MEQRTAEYYLDYAGCFLWTLFIPFILSEIFFWNFISSVREQVELCP